MENNMFEKIVELIRNASSVEEGTSILNKYLGAIIRSDEAQAIISTSLNEGPNDDYFLDKQADCFEPVVKKEVRSNFWNRYNNGDLKDYFKLQKEMEKEFQHEESFDSRNSVGLFNHFDDEDIQRVRITSLKVNQEQ